MAVTKEKYGRAPAARDSGAEVSADLASASDRASRTALRWRHLWQVPTIIVSIVVIVSGLRLAHREEPPHDFDGAFAQVEHLIAIDELKTAANLLETIQSRLGEATTIHRGRFYAVASDVLAASMDREQVWPAEHLRSVIDRYGKAEELGFHLDESRLERSAMAMLRLGLHEEVRTRLEDFELLIVSGDDPDGARAARNRVLRRLIESLVRAHPVNYEEAMTLIGDFRTDPLIGPEDELWAASQASELRLASARPREAIEHLIFDMRRLESRGMLGPLDFGPLHTQLAAAYADVGDYDFALDQVGVALDLLDSNEPARADALVVLGRILAAQSRFEESLDASSTVVTEFPGSDAYPSALLQRAEMLGVLGRHRESQADFRSLAEILKTDPPPHRPQAQEVVMTISEQRHDAALAMMNLPLALEYIELALLYFDIEQMPEPALRRLASTNRAIAERMLAEAGQSVGGAVGRASPAYPGASPTNEGQGGHSPPYTGVTIAFKQIDPGIRRQAAWHYKTAADYFMARARAVRDIPTREAEWGDSLWLAADSYDQAGFYDLAAAAFSEYINAHAANDPRWLEGKYRLARCHQASFEYDIAATLYEEVIDANPRSLWAMRAHVPLAACYVALRQPANAKHQLLQVVEGRTPLRPESHEYRDALIALGTLLAEEGEHRRAIEELTKAAEHYPSDPRIVEVRFRLADSHRRYADALAERLAPQTMPESEVRELQQIRREQLREAQTLFAHVIDALANRAAGPLDEFTSEMLRLARFYVADCTFALGEYERAIERYDLAVQHYDEHPASIVALIQIVNSYSAMGDMERAAAAHHRALRRLDDLPAAGAAPGALFDHDAWRRWLEALPPSAAVSSAVQEN